MLLIGLIACFHASALVFYSFSAASDVRLMNFGVEMVSGIVPSIFIFISLFFKSSLFISYIQVQLLSSKTLPEFVKALPEYIKALSGY